MLEKKEMYTIDELFEGLPIGLAELGRKANINEVTVARIKYRKAKSNPRRSTVNRLLTAMSEVYGRELSLKNVTGIEVSG